MSDNTLTILVVEPMKPPYVKQIPDDLQAMQKLVGGDIDATYPFLDPVAVVFNGEGKLNGLPPNRFLRTEDGKPYDIVCGTFFLAGLGEENFVSLTTEQIDLYRQMYSREMILAIPQKEKGKTEHER
ncbi:MAG: DUF3846 domain-containing protein [Faecousia sp.]